MHIYIACVQKLVLGHNHQFKTCVCVCMWRGVCIHLHLPIYMVLIVLLVFVCVRTSEQMGKLINGGSKISLSLSRSFILHFFFVLRMFVPIMLLSTRRQSHGLTSDRASMCTHTYTYNDDFIGNGC
jgi:hypothetical protein